MRQLPLAVVRAYRERILNVHAALLPLFGGRGMYGENVHRAVISENVFTGAERIANQSKGKVVIANNAGEAR